MDKLHKLLHKRLDFKLSKEMSKQKEEMKACFAKENIPYIDKDAFDYYRNEVIFKGVYNKKVIENAYLDGIVKMQDYYAHLDFKEKQRMMNYEVEECMKDLLCFNFDDTLIYIPFFDEKMNRIYRNEIVLFELKQYYRIMKDYTDLFVKDYYGICAYRSSFSSLQVVYEQDLQTAMYDKQSKRLFFLEDLKLQEYVTLSNAESDFEKIAQAYFTNDQKEYIELLLDTQNINEKIAKKAMKYCNRK